jgi:hypothetical protein
VQPQYSVGVLNLDAIQNILHDPLLSQFDDSTSPDVAVTAVFKASTLNDTDYVNIRKAERLYRSHEENWTDSNGQKKTKSHKAQAKSISLRTQLLALINSYFEKFDTDTRTILAKIIAADLNRSNASSGMQFVCHMEYSEIAAEKDLLDAATSRTAMNIFKLKMQCSKLKSELSKWTEHNPLLAAAAATDAAVRLPSTVAVTIATLQHLYDPINCENAAVALDSEMRLLTTSAAADIAYNFPKATVHETYKMITQYQVATARILHAFNTNTIACRKLQTEIQASLIAEDTQHVESTV